MDPTDRIVAAILTAGQCAGKPMEPKDYLIVYDRFLALFSERAAAAKKPMTVPKEALNRAKEMPPRRSR